jgi:hypothetical protein
VGLWSWVRRRGAREDPRLGAWKHAWTAAAASLDRGAAQHLRDRLNAFGLPDEDVEIEREMLDALEDAVALSTDIARAGLPIVETGHRVVGRDRCHFTAAASMPDEAGQPSGRLLLTSSRAVFVGGAAAVSTAWHMVAEARTVERDLLLVRTTGSRVFRFQCNSFSDALRGAIIARGLIRGVHIREAHL